MKKLLFLLSVVLCGFASQAQNLAMNSNKEVASNLNRHFDHKHMVLFGSGWDINEIQPFFNFLHSELGIGGTSVDMVPSAHGMQTSLSEIHSGSGKPNTLKLDFTCNQDGSNVTKLVVTGSQDWLFKIFFWYYHGEANSASPSGMIASKQVYTDFVKLYNNKLVIEKLK